MSQEEDPWWTFVGLLTHGIPQLWEWHGYYRHGIVDYIIDHVAGHSLRNKVVNGNVRMQVDDLIFTGTKDFLDSFAQSLKKTFPMCSLDKKGRIRTPWSTWPYRVQKRAWKAELAATKGAVPYHARLRGAPRLMGFPDAAYKNNSDGSLQRGQRMFICQPHNKERNTKGSLVDHESHKIPGTVLSTTIAELYEVLWISALLQRTLEGHDLRRSWVASEDWRQQPCHDRGNHLIQMLRHAVARCMIQHISSLRSQSQHHCWSPLVQSGVLQEVVQVYSPAQGLHNGCDLPWLRINSGPLDPLNPGESNQSPTPILRKVSRYTSHFSRDAFAKVCRPLGRK